MFQNTSTLTILSGVLSDYLGRPEHYLGIHTFFDGETIFSRNVIQVNFELTPFPVDCENVWNWFGEQLRGPSQQETLVYELGFDIERGEDPVGEKLIEITRGSGMTVTVTPCEERLR